MNEELKEIIKELKGPSRNVEMFARDCGVSPKKMYNVINGEFKRPLSDEFMNTMIANADIGSTVTIGDIKAAVSLKMTLDAMKAMNKESVWIAEALLARCVTDCKDIVVVNKNNTTLAKYDIKWVIKMPKYPDGIAVNVNVSTIGVATLNGYKHDMDITLASALQETADTWVYLFFLVMEPNKIPWKDLNKIKYRLEPNMSVVYIDFHNKSVIKQQDYGKGAPLQLK